MADARCTWPGLREKLWLRKGVGGNGTLRRCPLSAWSGPGSACLHHRASCPHLEPFTSHSCYKRESRERLPRSTPHSPPPDASPVQLQPPLLCPRHLLGTGTCRIINRLRLESGDLVGGDWRLGPEQTPARGTFHGGGAGSSASCWRGDCPSRCGRG